MRFFFSRKFNLVDSVGTACLFGLASSGDVALGAITWMLSVIISAIGEAHITTHTEESE